MNELIFVVFSFFRIGGDHVLIKPKKLQLGDKIATVSPSWGGAGDPELRWRYEQGVKRLEDVFGLEVIPMPNSILISI